MREAGTGQRSGGDSGGTGFVENLCFSLGKYNLLLHIFKNVGHLLYRELDILGFTNNRYDNVQQLLIPKQCNWSTLCKCLWTTYRAIKVL